MPAMQVIQKTQMAWGISTHLPSMLCAPHQLNKARQGEQSRAHVRCDCSGERLAKSGRNYQSIEITTTSFYERGFE